MGIQPSTLSRHDSGLFSDMTCCSERGVTCCSERSRIDAFNRPASPTLDYIGKAAPPEYAPIYPKPLLKEGPSIESVLRTRTSRESVTAAPRARRPAAATSSRKAAKRALLQWVQQTTAGYPGVSVVDFSGSWGNGLALCALLHAHYPEAIGDFSALSGSRESSRRKVYELGFRVAEEQVGMPAAMISVDDLVATYPRPDEKSIVLYVTMLHQKLGGWSNGRGEAVRDAPTALSRAVLGTASAEDPVSRPSTFRELTVRRQVLSVDSLR